MIETIEYYILPEHLMGEDRDGFLPVSLEVPDFSEVSTEELEGVFNGVFGKVKESLDVKEEVKSKGAYVFGIFTPRFGDKRVYLEHNFFEGCPDCDRLISYCIRIYLSLKEVNSRNLTHLDFPNYKYFDSESKEVA